MGLYGHRLLDAGASGDPLIYSLTLYERGAGSTICACRPTIWFDINQGAKLDLGSTAKLRTLITYLEIIAELHARLGGKPASSRSSPQPLIRSPPGRPAIWPPIPIAALPARPARGGMRRTYSASPCQAFLHWRRPASVRQLQSGPQRPHHERGEAFRHSVNLVFVRLMRDIVRYYVAVHLPFARDLVEDRPTPRAQYLVRFADSEGRAFLHQFYNQLGGLGADGRSQLVKEVRLRPDRLAVIYRSARPGAERAEFTEFYRLTCPT